MIRKTLTILSLLGLLISVAAWGVSYWNLFLPVPTPGRARMLGLANGAVYWPHPDNCSQPMICMKPGELKHAIVTLQRHRKRYGHDGFVGFDTIWSPTWIGGRYWRTVTPLWIPVLIFMSLPTHSLLASRHRRRKHRRLGVCVKCGYDLRGLAERCSECGIAFERE